MGQHAGNHRHRAEITAGNRLHRARTAIGVTTEAGLDVVANEKSLAETRMKMNEPRTSKSVWFIAAGRETDCGGGARAGSQFHRIAHGQFAEGFWR